MPIFPALMLFPLLLAVMPAGAAEIKSPQEQVKGYPRRIDDIPEGWATSNPIRLQVCFNLKYPVNSPEADAFLRGWYRSIHAMYFGVKLQMESVIRPVRFAHCGSLTFRNWRVNRECETSEVFLKYYGKRWKPAVTEAEEQLTVL